jgi:hypothetical protein
VSAGDAWPDQFLLRPDVYAPLSTDTMVWPSIWPLSTIPLPSWIGMNNGLWESLPTMRNHLAKAWTTPPPHATIAVSWFSDRAFNDAGMFGPYINPTDPGERSPEWRHLGFDVSDGTLLSGLSNCGYYPDEIKTLRPQWQSRLNAWHLFDAVEDAFEFRALTETRVDEHAPFFVFGLYMIEGDPQRDQSA